MSDNQLVKILLVDDDRFLLDMYSLKFKKAGLEVDISSTSVGALEKLKTERYDIILLEAHSPGIDGLELLKVIREEKFLPEVTLVMLTNEEEHLEKAKNLKVDGYIIKATTIPSEVVEEVLSIYKAKKK